MTLSPLGDGAVLIALGERIDEAVARRVHAVAREIERHPPAGVVEVVPAFTSVAVFYDRAASAGFAELVAQLQALAARAEQAVVGDAARQVEIPVGYGGEWGPDLEDVAGAVGMPAEAVVAAHAGADYLVHAIGFAPGFPYLGGLPPALALPRRASPRPQVPAGSVGIGGAQTGVYPFATPGGWNLIGRTPLALFDPTRAEPALLRTGDRVRFRAIGAEEFRRLAETSARSAPAEGKTDGQGNAAAGDTGDAVETIGIEVIRPGMLTTVQDLGRTGYAASGVPRGGAADACALRVANLLVGNPEGAAALEFTLAGPELRFHAAAVVALAGADHGVPRWRPLRVRAGERLDLSHAASGCRGYLAIAGGLAVPEVLGSRSTYLRAGFGGWEGRALRAGDRLRAWRAERTFDDHWRIDERILPRYSAAPTVRCVRGAQATQFDERWSEAEFVVTPQSDRMGMRLCGTPLVRRTRDELVSSAVAPGTIQVPPNGEPIVLLADAQTIGGYPQLAHVIAADLPLVAQLRPGDRVGFREVTLEEAHAAWLARERALGILREGLAQKLA